jgi:hypothetical protein
MSIDIGIICRTYESGGDPGAINHNDGPNGASSYGAYQFYSGNQTVQNFIAQLPPELSSRFNGLVSPSDAFNAMWVQVAKDSTDAFLAAQTAFAKANYYDEAVKELLKYGFDANKHSDVIKAVIFSAAIQFGPGDVHALFNTALTTMRATWLSVIDEGGLICYVYYTKTQAPWNKNNYRLIWRCMAECKDALNLLKSASGTK